MERCVCVFMYGSEPWPPGFTTLQLYAPVDLSASPELAELPLQWRAAVDGASAGLVQDKDLHVTLVIYSCQDVSQVGARLGSQARQTCSGRARWRCWPALGPAPPTSVGAQRDRRGDRLPAEFLGDVVRADVDQFDRGDGQRDDGGVDLPNLP